MSKKSTIKITCEIPELKQGFLEILLLSKSQLVQHLGQSLAQKGIKSDIKMTIQGDEVTVTQKSGDKGTVLVSHGIGYETVGYDTLPAFDKYMVVREGKVALYLKTPDNVDAHLGTFLEIEEAVANVNSNDVIDATKNIKGMYEAKTETVENGAESNNEVGDTTETV